jgi:osmotically-inducible protein OsmY
MISTLKKLTLLPMVLIILTAMPLYAQDVTTSDVWLESKITTTYTLNEHLNPFDLSVDVKDGVAILGGKVDSSVEKSLAVEIVKGMEGIKSVKNNIKIDPPSGKEEPSGFMTNVRNAGMVARVKSNLLWNRETSGMDIDVDADGGTVTLKGTVSSDVEKKLAVQLAENTSGVTRVKDRLTVQKETDNDTSTSIGKTIDQTVEKTEKAVSDGWITTKVKSRLFLDKDTDGLDIDVSTTNGVVTLTGVVASAMEKDYTIKLVENTVNVEKVVDQLSIAK